MVRQVLQQKGLEVRCEFGDFGIIEIDPNEIQLLEKNANFMNKSTFDLLVKNIERDNALSQLPLLIYDFEKNEFVVISGNHRVMASIKVGLKKIPCIIWLKEVGKDEVLRLQLSHNSIRGEDDKNILKEIIAGMVDIDSIELTGITEQYLKDLPTVQNVTLEAIDYEPCEVTFMFNKMVVEDIIETIDRISKETDGYIAVCGDIKYKEFQKLSRDVIAKCNVDNQNIMSLNLVIPILCNLALDKVQHPEREPEDLAIDGMKPIIFGSFKSSVEYALYEELRKGINKVGGIDIALDILNKALKEY